MKKLFTIFCLLFTLLSCDSESANDCIKSAGSVERRDIHDLPSFQAIRVEEGVELILSQDSVQKVTIEFGSNLMNNVSVEVIDSELILKNQATCNWVRDYSPAKVYVTITDLSRIYSVSQHKIHTTQKIYLNSVELMSGLQGEKVAAEFDMELDCEHLTVQANDATFFKLKGNSNSAWFASWAGEPRIDARDFKVNVIDVFQRSSNDMILYPINEIKGNIYGTGNVILKNTPPIIDLTQHYTGSLIID